MRTINTSFRSNNQTVQISQRTIAKTLLLKLTSRHLKCVRLASSVKKSMLNTFNMEISTIYHIAVSIAFACMLGAINSLLSYFLDYTFWEGSIFEAYLPALARWNLRTFAPHKLHLLNAGRASIEYDNECIKTAQNMFFFKILGGCAICSNIWLGAFTFTVLYFALPLNFIYILPYLLFSSWLLRKIMNA